MNSALPVVLTVMVVAIGDVLALALFRSEIGRKLGLSGWTLVLIAAGLCLIAIPVTYFVASGAWRAWQQLHSGGACNCLGSIETCTRVIRACRDAQRSIFPPLTPPAGWR